MTASGSLNLRAEPSGKIIASIPQYATLTVLERGSAWCNVQYGTLTGYVMTAYLTFDNTSASAPATSEPETFTLNATVVTASGSLNLRQSASRSANVLTTIPRLATVTVLQKGSEWCQITYGGVTGYVLTEFLQFSATETATPTSAPTSSDATQVTAWVLTPSGSLNLRESASSDSGIVAEMPRLSKVTLLEKGQTWSKLLYGEIIGYAMTEYLTTTDPATAKTVEPTATPAPTQTKAPETVADDPTLRNADNDCYAIVVPKAEKNKQSIYAACSEKSNVIEEIEAQSKVQLLRIGDTWCEVALEDGKVGFCPTECLEWIVS